MVADVGPDLFFGLACAVVLISGGIATLAVARVSPRPIAQFGLGMLSTLGVVVFTLVVYLALRFGLRWLHLTWVLWVVAALYLFERTLVLVRTVYRASVGHIEADVQADIAEVS